MQDDFDDGMELPDDELAGDSATDDGDLGLDGIDAEPEPVEEAQSRPSGGVRAKASSPAPARKAGGSAPAKKTPAKAVVAKKAAPKKAAPKKKAAAKKSAAPKKSAAAKAKKSKKAVKKSAKKPAKKKVAGKKK